MSRIVLKEECNIGYALCPRDHLCKSEDPIETVYTDWDRNGELVDMKKGFHLCPHLLLKAALEG